ncbi:MAG TPA: ABC transporter permease [Candidatus Methanofastidiosa archaeon]|nr:ABC transporter permease [Candidatus Methanofastidiosa archaeon]
MARRGMAFAVCRSIVVFFAVCTLVFVLPRLMPGDPVMNLIGEDTGVTQETINQLRHHLGLDNSIGYQYVVFIKGVLTGDLGYSYFHHKTVVDVLCERMKWTLLLALPSFLIGTIVGCITGAYAGYFESRSLSQSLSIATTLLYSAPPFVLSILALYVFSFKLGLFPMKGFYDSKNVMSILSHMVLPVSVLSIYTSAHTFVIMRGSVLQEKGSQYITAARARGLSETTILFRHVFKNALLPVLSMMAISLGFIFSGALLVEVIFSLNGMGLLIYDAVMSRNYPILQGAFLLITVMVLVCNIFADVAYSYLDPRIRRHGN